MKKIVAAIAVLLLCSFSTSNLKKAYQLFNKSGIPVDYNYLLQRAAEADIVLFGEFHNNPIHHWLQLELTADLIKKYPGKLVLGAEMFEADNQQALNDYLSGIINEKQFTETARLWRNYTTDYKPLVEIAKQHNLAFIATNIPRKYANLVYRGGFEALDTLSNTEKNWIAPLPIKYDGNMPAYKNIFEAAGGHGGENLPKSQAIKDATMAHFILKNYTPGKLFMHYNGTYHSNNFESIYWYLKQKNPSLKIMTIAVQEQENLQILEEKAINLGDVILVTPPTMTKTY